MMKLPKKKKLCVQFLNILVVLICVGGFSYQTLEFLFLYWEYPTIVDIQEISSSYLYMPAFTICNAIGYDFKAMCKLAHVCRTSKMNVIQSRYICRNFPESCSGGQLPSDYQAILFSMFMQRVAIKPEYHDLLRQRLEEYLDCTIEFGGVTKDCNMENVMGSFYSKDDLPHYCYTLYSLWGNPNKKREVIQKGSKMKFHFHLNTTRREYPDNGDSILPRYNVPTNPAVHIAVHSPYFLPSPFIEGTNFMGGKRYEMRITMKETRLLPHPYQTNCTDYLKMWRKRGGIGPINQLGVIQECRMNKMYDSLGCVPVTLDYPHNYTICHSCRLECNYNVSTDECMLLADSYNQPCDSIFYTTTSERKMIYVFENLGSESNDSLDDRSIRIPEHDCEGLKFWRKVCSKIDIDVLFDKYQATKITYNPKFENLELFSVIGGYLGIWLGVALLTLYNFLESLFVILKTTHNKRKKNRIQPLKGKQKHNAHAQDNEPKFLATYYSWKV